MDEAKLEQLLHQAVGDMGGTLIAVLARIGDELGLYAALKDAGPSTPSELATITGTAERYLREWLSAHAAAGYITYDSDENDGRFSLSEEQAELFADEDSPASVLGGFQSMLAATTIKDRAVEAFRTGKGIGWHEHHPDLFEGTERFFRPSYLANLVDAWIPALDGVQAKLEAGGTVADVGCGHGASTILMARAYPKSRFFGFDFHAPSIERARKRAAEAGVGNITFEVAAAKDFPGTGYDLVCHFDCLHDMGDPVGAAGHARQALAPDGTWMLIEPQAADDLAGNLNPLGKVFYAASTLVCTPASLSQEVGLGLGAQAGVARLAEVAERAGFSTFRKATETPFNLVLEGRP